MSLEQEQRKLVENQLVKTSFIRGELLSSAAATSCSIVYPFAGSVSFGPIIPFQISEGTTNRYFRWLYSTATHGVKILQGPDPTALRIYLQVANLAMDCGMSIDEVSNLE